MLVWKTQKGVNNNNDYYNKEMNKIFRDFEISADHLIPVRRPNQEMINKKKRTCQVDFAVLADQREKIFKKSK